MQDFEQLGAFYLGRKFDLGEKQVEKDIVLYDSSDLVTHAVCIGMTGSGKTGLCIGLIEEALLDRVPVLIIDPKGDLGNLKLTFPDLAPKDFAPWINEADAANKGMDRDAFARQQSKLWRKGLATWGQDGERIQRLRDAADVEIYTPGSEVGKPVALLKSFAAPPADVVEDRDLFQDRIATTATSLLALLGIDADPIRSREHILLSKILQDSWRKGQDLDLEALITEIQAPKIRKFGALDLDVFFPPADRFALSMQLNNLLAAPGFESWREGEAIDIDSLLCSDSGKVKASIFSIAHLSDTERMFFVSLLLNELLSWSRSQAGTRSLRAILYMDEIFGYFPPVQNPPSKKPLLTLLKQARAYGLGVVLATQNPVDLDYKGLSNTGTWFIGRLQTERDKERVLDGLEGAAAGQQEGFDRKRMNEVLAGLGSRVFLLNNVHEDRPEVFHTRWAMSYLRGPMTREEIKQLAHESAQEAPQEAKPKETVTPKKKDTKAKAQPLHSAPVLPPDIPQVFLPPPTGLREAANIRYLPRLLASLRIRFRNARLDIDTQHDISLLCPVTDNAVAVDWDELADCDIDLRDLDSTPIAGAAFAELPPAASQTKSYTRWKKELVSRLYAERKLIIYRCKELKLHSNAEESRKAFCLRLTQQCREERDRRTDALRKKYSPKLARVQQRLEKAQQSLEREEEQVRHQGLQTAISIGATLIGALLGRKSLSRSTVGKATTAARGAGRVLKERQDVDRAEENIELLKDQLADLDQEFKEEIAALEGRLDSVVDNLDEVEIRARKSEIDLRLLTLAWKPTIGVI